MNLTISLFSYFPLQYNSYAGICQSASRVFIFDYGGTLLHKEKYDIYIKRQTLSAIAGRKPTRKYLNPLLFSNFRAPLHYSDISSEMIFR